MALQPATTATVDINALVTRTPPPTSPGHSSTSSRSSRRSSNPKADTTGPISTSRVTSTTTPAPLPHMNAEPTYQQLPRVANIMPGGYPSAYSVPPNAYHQPASHYQPFLPADSNITPGPIPTTHAPGQGQKRLAQTPHPAESPAKKKQSKWSSKEDALITDLRGNGMTWEDISKHLPDRSAISCRLRFQNYFEGRPEWDEEKMNKLARLYERFRKEMWEKIAKVMQIPWRAAENMHWQMGEIDMAQRANVSVFHLAGQQPSYGGAMAERVPGTSPPSGSGVPISMSYSQTHNRSHPFVWLPQPRQLTPARSRMHDSDRSSSPNVPLSRRRANSNTTMPTPASSSGNLLPPPGEVVSHSTPSPHYGLPPLTFRQNNKDDKRP